MNSKKAITLLVLATLLLTTLPIVPVKAIAVTSTSSYDVVYDDTITVLGTGVTAGATVEVYWDAVQPWDGEAGKLNSTKAKSSGAFEVDIDVPDGVQGDHYVWVKDLSTGDTANDLTPIKMHPSIELDPDSALPNDDIDMTGHGFEDEVEIISIVYTDVVNITLSTSPSTPETDEVGKWTASFDVPAGLAYGVYPIYAEDENGHQGTEDLTVGASITLDVDNGPVGTLVQIKGRGFSNGGLIDTGSVRLDGTIVTVENDDTISGSKFEFTIEVVVPSLPDGDREFKVTDGVNVATEDFEIDEDGDASFEVTPTFGVQGSTIAIAGYNYSMVNEGEVIVELWDENDLLFVVDVDDYETDNDGEWDGTFKVPAQNNDKYTLRAYQPDYGINATESFKIGSVIVILSDDSGPSGLEIVLTGTGFEYNVDWNATMGDETVIEDGAATDGSGNLQVGGQVPKFYVPSMDPGVYTITVMDEEETTVEVEFELTETTMVETDPLVAPADPDGDEYNVTIIGTYFSQEDGAGLEFVLYNDTDEWDINVYEGDFNAPFIYNEDDKGEWEAWWEVDNELYIGSYTLNVTDDNDMFAQYTLELVSKTVALEPRKSTFRIGDTVGFNIEHSFGSYDSYIKIYDPSGELYWQTDAFEEDEWIKVGTVVRLPFFEQVAGGNPLVLLDDAPLGTWDWTWFVANADEDDEDDILDTGTFEVAEAEADILAGQVEDLNNQITDLAGQIGDVSAEFDDVRSEISNVAAIAQQAVDAAEQATAAVQQVAQTANQANTAAAAAETAANAARDAANSLTTLVYGAIGAALVAALAAIVSLMQISRRIAG
jgi:hypothetical protein